MNHRWSKHDRKMMQVIVHYFKIMMKAKSKKEFLRLGKNRRCGFCYNHSVVNNCSSCRIFKVFNGKCHSTFPIWAKFQDSRIYYNTKKSTLPQFKKVLRKAITELEPWGLK